MASLVITSNRGPAPARRAQPGAGGLLTGLTRALKGETGTWVSVLGANDADLTASGVRLDRVAVDPHQFDAYYNQVSNSLLWPLHLGLVDHVASPAESAWQA